MAAPMGGNGEHMAIPGGRDEDHMAAPGSGGIHTCSQGLGGAHGCSWGGVREPGERAAAVRVKQEAVSSPQAALPYCLQVQHLIWGQIKSLCGGAGVMGL